MASLSSPAPAANRKKFILRGWKAFAEERGVNKKEIPETFEWCDPYNRHYFSDCRVALEKIEGAKEWLKTYTCDKNHFPFRTGLGAQIVLSGNHSGASFNRTLWKYKYLLNNWDTYVYEEKKGAALELYRDATPPIYVYRRLLANCEIYEKKKTPQMYDLIMGDWSMYSPEGDAAKTVDEIKRVMIPLVEELEELWKEDGAREIERNHAILISSLEFLYEHPMRWFDSPSGCSISPGHPNTITSRAMDEMEKNFPGYKHHIEMVKNAILRMNSYSDVQQRGDWAFMKKFMDEQGVVAGVV